MATRSFQSCRTTISFDVSVRSQSGPAARVTFSTTPSSPLTRIKPALFRVLLQRRLSLSLPLTRRSCRCGRPLDALGHHRAGCAKLGVLARRGFALESAAARMCRETGARVVTNMWVRDITDVSKLWQLGCPSVAASSWRWTQQKCQQCGGTDNPGELLTRRTAYRSDRPVDGKRRRIPSSCILAHGHAWSSWRWKSVGGGPKKHESSFSCWRAPE